MKQTNEMIRRMKRTFHLFSLVSALASVFFLTISNASAQRPRLVPFSYRVFTDSLGFRWDISSDGQVQDGTNDCFDGGLRLNVGGRRFSGTSDRRMDPSTGEIILREVMGNLEVTRRIKLKSQNAFLRYVDSFRNTSDSTVTSTVTIQTELGGSCQSYFTDQGRQNPVALKGDECGLVIFQGSFGRPSVVFHLCHPRSKVKPSVIVEYRRRLRFTFSISLRPKEEKAIAYSVAQRSFTSPPSKVELAKLLAPLNKSGWLSDIPGDIRDNLINWQRFGWRGELGRVSASIERLLDMQAKYDLLLISSETKFRGKADIPELTIKTAYGECKVKEEDVFAVVGGDVLGESVRIYLRDGQVLTGRTDKSEIGFSTTTGFSISVSLQRLDTLLGHKQQTDLTPPSGAIVFVETYTGNRLAVTEDVGAKVTALTKWGAIELSLGEIKSIKPVSERFVGHVFFLKNGSNFVGYLQGDSLQLKTVLFGRREIPVEDIQTIVQAKAPSEEETEEEISLSYIVLSSGSRVVGRPELTEIELLTDSGEFAIPVADIRSINLSEEGGLDFVVQLWDGSVALGGLKRLVFPFRVGNSVWYIPVSDLKSYNNNAPVVPKRLSGQIAALIRQLGDESWEKREEAMEKLKDLGYLARPQLQEAAQQSKDPEIRRRAEKLLSEIER